MSYPPTMNAWPNRTQLAAPPTISQQAQIIANWLTTSFAAPRGGSVKILQNQRHLWEEIYMQDDTPRLFIMFKSEKSRGGFNQANKLHRVDRQWSVIIMRGHGWRNLMPNPNEAFGTQAEDFLDTIEVLRDKLRVLLNISEEFPIDYTGVDSLPNIAPTKEANVFMDCYIINFSTANDIPNITLT